VGRDKKGRGGEGEERGGQGRGSGTKLNPTQQKHAFTNQKKCTTTQNKNRKLKPGLVAFYDMRPGNGVGLCSKKKISKRGDK